MHKNRNITHGYTKHYYAGSERILSKVGGGGLSDIDADPKEEYGADPVKKQKIARAEYEMAWECLGTLNPVCKGNSLTGNVYNVTQEQTCPFFTNLYSMKEAIAPENDLYFYHSDHFGSASWITNTYGQAIQYLLYLPFGETMVDQRTTTLNSRYSFSAKEKDEESGYHYFGARYYDSDISIWLSVDPMASKYPSLTPYNYCLGNPIKLIDPDGKIPWYFLVENWNKSKTPNPPTNARLHPTLNVTRPHHGMDMSATTGTSIHSAASGKVLFAGEKKGYGNTVVIDHGNNYYSLYAHMSKIEVKQNADVSNDQVIGEVGMTGGISSGPHLHVEYIKTDNPINIFGGDKNSTRFNPLDINDLQDIIDNKEMKIVPFLDGIKRALGGLEGNSKPTTPTPESTPLNLSPDLKK